MKRSLRIMNDQTTSGKRRLAIIRLTGGPHKKTKYSHDTESAINKRMDIERDNFKVLNFLGVYLCPIVDCKFSDDSLRNYFNHLTDRHPDILVCPEGCELKFRRLKEFGDHYKNAHLIVDGKFKCDECGLVYHNYSSQINHKIIMHRGLSYECKLCGYEEDNRIWFMRHLKRSHGIKNIFKVKL